MEATDSYTLAYYNVELITVVKGFVLEACLGNLVGEEIIYFQRFT
jgi:hypothetical protein